MSTVEILSERQAFIVLNALPNIGPITLNRILGELGGDPRAVFTAGRRRLEAVKGVGPVIAEWARDQAAARENFEVDVVDLEDAALPERLSRDVPASVVALHQRLAAADATPTSGRRAGERLPRPRC